MKVRRLSAQRGQAARPRCPWCHQSASPSDLRVRCQGCQASLHLACAADAKACPTLGCRGPFSEATPRGRRL
ncbi:MAG: hypothetical protein KDD82_02975, partial [Planctomycetes bacterium]|nr:hypothetical protein [Planctomycetota bacterium]